ncbi:unnamed protein product [Heterobilharzia americana]|nr:unnamed protein product [Heterobilharzia americana]
MTEGEMKIWTTAGIKIWSVVGHRSSTGRAPGRKPGGHRFESSCGPNLHFTLNHHPVYIRSSQTSFCMRNIFHYNNRKSICFRFISPQIAPTNSRVHVRARTLEGKR